MKGRGEAQDLHYKTQHHSCAVRKGAEHSNGACPPSFPRTLEATGEAIKHPSDPVILLKFLVATVRIQLGNKIWHCAMLIQKNHQSQTQKIKW